MIIFKKLRWKNLLSTGNVFTEVSLNTNTTTLIVGENGAGKSTILDALTFVLFGKPFRKINKPQLLNTITQKNMVVEVEFNVGKTSYKIARGIKPNLFEVYKDDVLIDQNSNNVDYQQVLEKKILKVNYKSFCQVVILGSATYQPFMSLKTSARREIIEDLLDLQIFTLMNSALTSKISKNNEDFNKVQTDKRLIEEKIKLIREHLKELQNNNDILIKDKKDRIKETNDKINLMDHEYNELKQKIDSLYDKSNDTDVSKKLKKLEALRHQIQAKLSVIKNDVSFFENHDNCPTCKQIIDESFKDEMVTNKTTEIEEINNGLKLLDEQYIETNKNLESIMEIQKQIRDLNLEMHTLNTRKKSMLEYVDTLETELKSITKATKKIDDSKILELEAELIENSNQYNIIAEQKNILGIAKSFLKDDGIKAKIIKQYVPIINKLINKYLSSMEFMCQFELNENFEEKIKSRYRDEFSYESFSEGEKMRINLAILFTWRAVAKMRNSINTNLLIMDEVFDSSLDFGGTEEFLKVINSLTKDSNVVIISHKTDQLYEKFDKVLKFEKYKNFSRIA